MASSFPGWFGRGGLRGSIPEPLQDILGPYGGWLAAQVAHDPLGFARFALSNAGHLLARTVTLLLPSLPGPQLLYGAFLAPILILGLWEVYSRSRVFTLTLVFSFGILLVWPYQEIRLMVPFQPLLMLSLIMGGGRILQDLTLPKGFRRLFGLLALGWVVFFSSVQIFRLSFWLDRGFLPDPVRSPLRCGSGRGGENPAYCCRRCSGALGRVAPLHGENHGS